MKNYTKKELHDLLVRRAGAIEDINRVNEDTEHELFVDSYDCIRQIMIHEEVFREVCEILDLTFEIDQSYEDDLYDFEARAKIELFGKEYDLISLISKEGEEE